MSSTVGSAGILHSAIGGPVGGTQQLAAQGQQGEVWRELYRHEKQIAALKAENKALKKAFCVFHPREPICKRASNDYAVGTGNGTEDGT